MKKRVFLEKRIGETPLEAVTAWKAAHPRYRDVPASYAGRLDPMASGKLLVLLGEECKRQKEYTALDKEYEVEVLLDVGSDTGDVLGIVEASGRTTAPGRKAIREALRREIGTHTVPYPAFSSKTVGGVPLFLHALRGTLGDIETPMHEESIYRIRLRDMYVLSKDELEARVNALLALAPKSDEPSKELGADFRIAAVTDSWKRALADDRPYQVLSLSVSCGSGTYMRSLAERLGASLSTRALALSIRRTRIGKRFFGI